MCQKKKKSVVGCRPRTSQWSQENKWHVYKLSLSVVSRLQTSLLGNLLSIWKPILCWNEHSLRKFSLRLNRDLWGKKYQVRTCVLGIVNSFLEKMFSFLFFSRWTYMNQKRKKFLERQTFKELPQRVMDSQKQTPWRGRSREGEKKKHSLWEMDQSEKRLLPEETAKRKERGWNGERRLKVCCNAADCVAVCGRLPAVSRRIPADRPCVDWHHLLCGSEAFWGE